MISDFSAKYRDFKNNGNIDLDQFGTWEGFINSVSRELEPRPHQVLTSEEKDCVLDYNKIHGKSKNIFSGYLLKGACENCGHKIEWVWGCKSCLTGGLK